VFARSHCDDADAVLTGGADVGGCIADGADGRIGSCEISSFQERLTVDGSAGFKSIAEGVEIEILPESA